MPRATNGASGQATGVLAFFRKAPMEIAELVLGLAKGAIAERKGTSAKIAAGQRKAGKDATAPAGDTAAGAAAAVPAGKKKRIRNRGKNRQAATVAAIAESAGPGPGAVAGAEEVPPADAGAQDVDPDAPPAGSI